MRSGKTREQGSLDERSIDPEVSIVFWGNYAYSGVMRGRWQDLRQE